MLILLAILGKFSGIHSDCTIATTTIYDTIFSSWIKVKPRTMYINTWVIQWDKSARWYRTIFIRACLPVMIMRRGHLARHTPKVNIPCGRMQIYCDCEKQSKCHVSTVPLSLIIRILFNLLALSSPHNP